MKKLIRKIKELLGIDLDYVIRNGGLIGIAHLVGTACGFFITLLLANFIDSTTYGQYKYAVSVAGIISAFSLTGAGSAVLQSVAKGYDGSYFFERALSLKWGLPAIIVSLCVGIYYIVLGDAVLGWSVMLMGMIGYAQSIFLLHTSYLNGKKDFKRLARNQVLGALVNLFGVLLAVLTGFTSVIWLIVAYNGAQLLFQFYASRKTEEEYAPKGEPSVDERTLSRHLSLGNIIPLISEFLDKVLIFQFLGPYQLAIYAFAVGIPDQVRSINKLINAIVIPKLSAKTDTKLHESVTKHTKTYLITTIGLTLLFWVIAEPLYRLFFPQYVESAFYASVYITILPIIASGMLFGHALQIQNRVASLYSIRLVDSCIKIGLFVVLIPRFGVLGAVCSILIAKAVTMLIQVFLYFKNERGKEKT